MLTFKDEKGVYRVYRSRVNILIQRPYANYEQEPSGILLLISSNTYIYAVRDVLRHCSLRACQGLQIRVRGLSV